MKAPLTEASCSQFDTRRPQLAKSGEVRTVTLMPTFFN